MLLKKSDSADDLFDLTMSAVEWREVKDLSKFAEAALTYDCAASYVAQALTYKFVQPKNLQSDADLQAAFTAVDQLQVADTARDAVLSVPKAQIHQLLLVLAFAADAEEQAARLLDAFPDEFPHIFPALALPASYYVDSFDRLRTALYGDASLKIDRPVNRGPNNG